MFCRSRTKARRQTRDNSGCGAAPGDTPAQQAEQHRNQHRPDKHAEDRDHHFKQTFARGGDQADADADGDRADDKSGDAPDDDQPSLAGILMKQAAIDVFCHDARHDVVIATQSGHRGREHRRDHQAHQPCRKKLQRERGIGVLRRVWRLH